MISFLVKEKRFASFVYLARGSRADGLGYKRVRGGLVDIADNDGV